MFPQKKKNLGQYLYLSIFLYHYQWEDKMLIYHFNIRITAQVHVHALQQVFPLELISSITSSDTFMTFIVPHGSILGLVVSV